ncbi:MAG: hypothetical protein A4E28_01062 [Methanocella sp. PtaU1.Bin125]|nr:MAG: hypothetical protein A4E28_01062 [Methanocella sp. PtaU1.Bin125]
MNKRLIMLIAVVFTALIVSGCCVCCVPCGRTKYAYAPGEILNPVRTTLNATASTTRGNVSSDATLLP